MRSSICTSIFKVVHVEGMCPGKLGPLQAAKLCPAKGLKELDLIFENKACPETTKKNLFEAPNYHTQ